MLNLSSYLLLSYMLGLEWMQRPGRSDPVSKSVLPSAELPRLLTDIDPNLRLHAGIFVMIAAVILVHWLLFKTRTGFEYRASGENPDAARYAGMHASAIIVFAMATAGALAGLAGANQVLGVLERATPGFSVRYRLRCDFGGSARPFTPGRRALRRPSSSVRWRPAAARCRWMRAFPST